MKQDGYSSRRLSPKMNSHNRAFPFVQDLKSCLLTLIESDEETHRALAAWLCKEIKAGRAGVLLRERISRVRARANAG